MARKDALPGSRERIADRRIEVFELRKTGMELREIAKIVGTSHGTVHQDLKKVLAERLARRDEVVEEYVEIQKAQLNSMVEKYWPKVQEGDIGAGYLLLAVLKRQAELLGLDAPIRQELSTNADLPMQIEVLYALKPPQQLAAPGSDYGNDDTTD